MKDNNKWSNIIKAIKNWRGVIVLVVLVAESFALAMAGTLEDENKKFWIYAIMMILLGFVVIGVFLYRIYSSGRASIEKNGIPITDKSIAYLERDKATPSMYKDMLRSKSMTFMGISNKQLSFYFKKAIERAQTKDITLPVESIDVFFAKDAFGRIWEEEKFRDNVNESINNICQHLTQVVSKERLPHLKQINFYQNSHRVHLGGSSFIYANRDGSKNKVSAIYISLYFPSLTPNTRNSYTLRLDSKSKDLTDSNLFKKYSIGIQNIYKNKILLFSYDVENIWDKSAVQWDRFVKSHSVYRKIMNVLMNFGKIKSTDCIIDLGCATGRTSLEILKKKSRVHLHLLDSSSEMIRFSKDVIDKGNIKRLLCDAKTPHLGEDYYGIFDKVISHFSIQSLVEEDNFHDFAILWSKYIKVGGYFVFLVHDSVLLDVEEVEGFHEWEDPLRKLIIERFEANGFPRRPIKKTSKIKKSDIVSGFKSAGYVLEEEKLGIFERTMEDRCCLWRVPAILSKLIDITQTNQKTIDSIMDEIRKTLKNVKTKPTALYFYRFKKVK